MVVAPPGSMKTVLLEALSGLPNCHFVDKLTVHTFLSGQIQTNKKQTHNDDPLSSPSLLHRIGASGILIYADFSTIIAMGQEHRDSILADMRRIYDGRLKREYGTDERPKERSWEGRITFAAAATPAIDSHFSVFQSLGERFVLIRPSRPNGVLSARSAITQDRLKARTEMSEAVRVMFGELLDFEPDLGDSILDGISSLAEFTVRARTHVPRASWGDRHIQYVPEAEAPTRLGQQLAQLAKGSALLGPRGEVDDEDMAVVRRVAFDCIPQNRWTILKTLAEGKMQCEISLPAKTKQYAMEELEALGLTTKENGAAWTLTQFAADLLRAAGFYENIKIV